MTIQPKLLFLLLFFVAGKARSQSTEKTLEKKNSNPLELYNAYSLAKSIAQFNPAEKPAPADMLKLVGGILWYTKNDVDSLPNMEKIREYIFWHYPVLSVKFNEITDSLTGNIDLQKSGKKDLQLAIKDKVKLNRITSLIDTINTLNFMIEGNSILLRRTNDTLRKLIKKSLSAGNKRDNNYIRDSAQIAGERSQYENMLQDQMIRRNNTANVLANYTRDSLTYDERTALNKIYIQYKLTDQFTDQTEKYTSQYNPTEEQSKILQTSGEQPARIALPTQAQLIDALAIYLVKRVKQESVLWFFETLRKQGNAYELVRTTFPNTIELLQGNEMYEAPKMGSLWRYAISKDFISMPETLLNSEWIKSKISPRNIGIIKSLLTAIRLARMIEQNYTYKDMIAVLYTEIPYADKFEKANLNTLISLLYCLNADFFRKAESGFQRLQITDLMYMTDQEFEIMISLVDMKYNHVLGRLMLKTDTLNIGNTAQLNVIRKWLGGILMKVQQFDNRRADMENLQKLAKSEDNEYQFSNNTTWKFAKDLLEGLLYTDTVHNQTFKADHASLRTSIKYMADVQEFFQMLEKKNFAGSVNVLFEIVESITHGETIQLSRKQLEDKMKDLRFQYYRDVLEKMEDRSTKVKFGYETFAKGDSVTITRNSLLHYLLKSTDQGAINIIRKLAGFLNDVAVTKSSKELAKVIEAYALPPGSYKMKRNTWSSFDINAYVGVYSGYEWTRKDTAIKNNESRSAIVYGLTAPIGVTISKTFGKKEKDPVSLSTQEKDYRYHPDRLRFTKNNIWSRRSTTLSAFFSIIDIGAVVSYRFNNNDETVPQKMKLEQVFSPGMHLSIGIQGTPLVVSAGYEYTPALRKLTSTLDRQFNMHRVYLGVLFDIPLFNIAYASDGNRYIRRKDLR